MCNVQCAMRCVKWSGERTVWCGAGSISHFLPRMETRGRTHQQMGRELHCNVKLQYQPGAKHLHLCSVHQIQGWGAQVHRCNTALCVKLHQAGPGEELPFSVSPQESIFSGTPQPFDDLIRSGNSGRGGGQQPCIKIKTCNFEQIVHT